MRHYLYISDVKLDMYYKQIPPPLRDKIAVDLKIDLKIFSATIKEQPLEESRYQKLRLVEQYLRNNEKVGSVKEPATWVAGTEPMKWATISSGSEKRGDLVLFGAKLPSYIATNSDVPRECRVGLVGSRHHIVGYKGEGRAAEYAGSSALGDVVQHLGQALAHKLDDLDSEYQGRHRSKSDHDTLEVVIKSVGGLSGDEQRLEFLAKKLTAGPKHRQGRTIEVVFGTPLYVAMSD